MPKGRPPKFDREASLDRAMRLFWEKGYEGTSMSDLTQALGIGRQSLYGGFGDKRELFVLCLERYTEQVLEKSLFAELDDEGSPLAAIERVLDAWEAYANSDAFLGCLLGKSLAELGRRDSELDRLLRAKLDRIQKGFERALTRAKLAGELTASADARALARSVTAFAQGAAVVCQVWRDPRAVRETMLGARALIAAYKTPPARARA
jgi:TetR/AcrR family transcriptional repressor of nem operon